MTGKLRVLCVDDDLDIRTIAVMSLSLDPAMEARGAGSGAEALELIEADEWRPDAVLLDVMMGGTNGPAVLHAIRNDASLADIRIIFMTARAGTAALEEYRALGVAGVIVKPFDPIDLAAQVRALVDAGA